MIKYNKQLENRNEYYLPLIDKFERGKVNCNFKIPLSFYIKNKDILEESKYYINLFKKINIEKYYRENSFQSFQLYMETGDILDEYNSIDEELHWVEKEYNKIDFKEREIENLVLIVLRILKLLKNIYPHNKEIYEKSINKFMIANEEIKNLNSIIYNKNALKYKKVFLPDSWFILPNQVLYNTGNGHKGSNLVVDFYYRIEPAFEYSKTLEGMSKHYCELAKEIKGKGFTEGHFKTFLNLIYFPVYTNTTYGYPTCHEKFTTDHIIGIVMAKAYFYNFFIKMQQYCHDHKKEFEKLKQLTNSDLADIFVRCCGFHKVESQITKTITTSDVNYKESFKEYIEKGWNIVFIPPIIIKRDLGIISELDMESHFVKKYMK